MLKRRTIPRYNRQTPDPSHNAMQANSQQLQRMSSQQLGGQQGPAMGASNLHSMGSQQGLQRYGSTQMQSTSSGFLQASTQMGGHRAVRHQAMVCASFSLSAVNVWSRPRRFDDDLDHPCLGILPGYILQLCESKVC